MQFNRFDITDFFFAIAKCEYVLDSLLLFLNNIWQVTKNYDSQRSTQICFKSHKRILFDGIEWDRIFHYPNEYLMHFFHSYYYIYTLLYTQEVPRVKIPLALSSTSRSYIDSAVYSKEQKSVMMPVLLFSRDRNHFSHGEKDIQLALSS